MINKQNLLICAFSALTLVGCQVQNDRITPVNLRTEYLTNPLGIDADNPRFTWEYEGEQPDFKVSRSEVLIGTSPDNMRTLQPGMKLSPQTRYYWSVNVWDEHGIRCKSSKVAFFETGKRSQENWKAQWITDNLDKETEPAPMFRKSFMLKKPVKKATASVAAAGYYDLFINGQRVGNHFLDPGYTHFNKRILYVTHDITPYISSGDNAVAAVLGNGWYNGQSVAVWNFHEAAWRNRPSMICELQVEYNDGSTETILTDGSWKTNTGPYTYNNLYSGDRYDARLEEDGWQMASFDDSAWKPVEVINSPAEQLVSQQMPAIKVTEEIAPSAFKAFNDQLYVYSFPKNFSGVCKIGVKGEKGTLIRLKHGELLKPDGRLDQGNIDVYYHPVKEGEIFQTDEFVLKGTGEEEIFIPSFTYHGFQHVEVESSLPVALTQQSLTGLFMHTAINPVGKFSCSNPLLTKIWDATMQAYRSNLHSIPTDCPQREKNGWTADAHVAIDLGLLGFDGITLYEKWMNDFIDNQREEGDVSGIIPSSGWGFGSWIGPVWDAAMFIIPNSLYNYYGDTQSIENLYPTLQKYLKYLNGREENGYLTYGLGDWVYWKATTNNTYTSTAFYCLDNALMAKFASLTGNENDSRMYQDKANELKKMINDRFFDAQKATYAEGTQTAQALALYLDLVPEGYEQAVADQLCTVVRDNNHFLDFGLLGSKTVPAMLTKYGYVEDAMKMLTKTEAPSWGYWVETMGYSTLPETWTLSPVYRDASLNHVFMGDVSAWMMNHLAGINYDPEQPGFENILITPKFVEGLDWAKGSYHSVKGLISSEWKRNDDKIALTVTVPLGATATIQVGDQSQTVTGGMHVFQY